MATLRLVADKTGARNDPDPVPDPETCSALVEIGWVKGWNACLAYVSRGAPHARLSLVTDESVRKILEAAP